MKKLLFPLLTLFIINNFSCSYEPGYFDYYEYSREMTELIKNKDWYIVGLSCDGNTVPGDYDTSPFLRFPDSDACADPVYLLTLPLYTCHPWDEEYYWFESNNIGEFEMRLYDEYQNASFVTTYEFKIFDITEESMTMLVEDFPVFPEYEHCWITLESRN